MDKIGMREWICSIELMVDNKLTKWLKHNKIENGASVHLGWQFEQTHIQLDVFWEDTQESVKLTYRSPRNDQSFLWHGLDDRTFNRVMDRVGNLAMGAMHPPIDPMD